MVWKSSPQWSILNAFMLIARGVIPFVLLFLIKQLIDTVTQTLSQPADQRDFYPALWVVVLSGGLFLLNGIVNAISNLVREKQAHKINDYVQALIHDKTTRINYSFFEDPDYQDIYFRAISDANYRPTRIYYGFLGLIQNSLTILLLGGMLISLNWWMALALSIVIVPTVFHSMLYSRRLFLLSRSQTEDERRVAYYNRLLTVRDYAKELRVFDLGNLFQLRYEALREGLRDKQMDLMVRKTKGEIITQVITTLVIIAFYGVIVVDAIKGVITAGSMMMYFLALQRGYGYFQDMLGRLSGLYEDSLFVRNFIDFVNIETPDGSDNQNKAFPKVIQKGIRLENVSFRYPHSTKWVLHNLNLTICPGETIALVGANGAGKTSLVKLLAGLYSPNEGNIFIDDVNLDFINRTSLSENISVIFQDFMLYNTTALENIWFGNINRPISDSDIQGAAANSGIHNLISNLPKGYDTMLGNLFHGSEELSVGEWQRLALARSFYNDAQIIILDEPTSSLDAFTEANLIQHFKDIVKDRTAIIVSHRLSTLNLADRIAVIENAQLVEFGTKEELLAREGVFYRMVKALK
jgi:ATP-binding cassette subfamily B protein